MPKPIPNPRRENAASLFAQCQQALRCPICGKFIVAKSKNGVLVCKNRHSFDISKYGAVNFAGNGGLKGYDKQLFQSRRAVFDEGFYNPVADEIFSLVENAAKECSTNGRECNVLDSGCGEGFYSAYIQNRFAKSAGDTPVCRLYGIDLSRDAISMAAQQHSGICWCVADLANLPFKTSSMDMVLDILAPANYAEFKRVLRKNTPVVKVIPGSSYLTEIRALASRYLSKAEYTAQPVETYTKEQMKVLYETELNYQKPLTSAQAEHFLRLTPLTSGIAAEKFEAFVQEAAQKMSSITINLKIIQGLPL